MIVYTNSFLPLMMAEISQNISTCLKIGWKQLFGNRLGGLLSPCIIMNSISRNSPKAIGTHRARLQQF